MRRTSRLAALGLAATALPTTFGATAAKAAAPTCASAAGVTLAQSERWRVFRPAWEADVTRWFAVCRIDSRAPPRQVKTVDGPGAEHLAVRRLVGNRVVIESGEARRRALVDLVTGRTRYLSSGLLGNPLLGDYPFRELAEDVLPNGAVVAQASATLDGGAYRYGDITIRDQTGTRTVAAGVPFASILDDVIGASGPPDLAIAPTANGAYFTGPDGVVRMIRADGPARRLNFGEDTQFVNYRLPSARSDWQERSLLQRGAWEVLLRQRRGVAELTVVSEETGRSTRIARVVPGAVPKVVGLRGIGTATPGEVSVAVLGRFSDAPGATRLRIFSTPNRQPALDTKFTSAALAGGAQAAVGSTFAIAQRGRIVLWELAPNGGARQRPDVPVAGIPRDLAASDAARRLFYTDDAGTARSVAVPY